MKTELSPISASTSGLVATSGSATRLETTALCSADSLESDHSCSEARGSGDACSRKEGVVRPALLLRLLATIPTTARLLKNASSETFEIGITHLVGWGRSRHVSLCGPLQQKSQLRSVSKEMLGQSKIGDKILHGDGMIGQSEIIAMLTSIGDETIDFGCFSCIVLFVDSFCALACLSKSRWSKMAHSQNVRLPGCTNASLRILFESSCCRRLFDFQLYKLHLQNDRKK